MSARTAPAAISRASAVVGALPAAWVAVTLVVHMVRVWPYGAALELTMFRGSLR